MVLIYEGALDFLSIISKKKIYFSKFKYLDKLDD